MNNAIKARLDELYSQVDTAQVSASSFSEDKSAELAKYVAQQRPLEKAGYDYEGREELRSFIRHMSRGKRGIKR